MQPAGASKERLAKDFPGLSLHISLASGLTATRHSQALPGPYRFCTDAIGRNGWSRTQGQKVATLTWRGSSCLDIRANERPMKMLCGWYSWLTRPIIFVYISRIIGFLSSWYVFFAGWSFVSPPPPPPPPVLVRISGAQTPSLIELLIILP